MLQNPRNLPVRHTYLLGLGSNVYGGANRTPEKQLIRAILELRRLPGTRVVSQSPIIATRPLGPSLRRYANGAVIIETAMSPPALLRTLKALELEFGRRAGRRWGARPLDLDIILWSGGRWKSRTLTVPHIGLPQREFVLAPAQHVAADWRVPMGHLKIRHLTARLRRRRSVRGNNDDFIGIAA